MAENSAGVAKMILDVDVYVPPQFVKNFNTDVELFEHGSAIVTCDASGSPPPSVIWQRSGRLLKGNGSPRQEGAQEREKSERGSGVVTRGVFWLSFPQFSPDSNDLTKFENVYKILIHIHKF